MVRSLLLLAGFSLILFGDGCVVPLPSKVSQGHRYSREALKFLDLPDTSRQEVLSSLGEPTVEVRDPGVLLYTWQTTSRALFAPDNAPDTVDYNAGRTIGHTGSQMWGLFIAYDERGQILGHEVRKLDSGDPAHQCTEWRLSKGPKL